MRGASLCPRKIFAEAFIDSAAVVPIVICKMIDGWAKDSFELYYQIRLMILSESNAVNISLDVDPTHKHLEQPSQLDDQPLHGSQVEEHRDEEVEEVDDGQHLTIRIRTFFNKIHF